MEHTDAGAVPVGPDAALVEADMTAAKLIGAETVAAARTAGRGYRGQDGKYMLG